MLFRSAVDDQELINQAQEQTTTDMMQAPPPDHQQQPHPLSRSAQLQLEERRLRILQIIRDANGYIANELNVQQLLDEVGHRISFDRLRTDLAWLYEQHLVYLQTDTLWVIHLTRQGLELVDGRIWVPGIRRAEPVL